jgi:hypothetical protein
LFIHLLRILTSEKWEVKVRIDDDCVCVCSYVLLTSPSAHHTVTTGASLLAEAGHTSTNKFHIAEHPHDSLSHTEISIGHPRTDTSFRNRLFVSAGCSQHLTYTLATAMLVAVNASISHNGATDCATPKVIERTCNGLDYKKTKRRGCGRAYRSRRGTLRRHWPWKPRRP